MKYVNIYENTHLTMIELHYQKVQCRRKIRTSGVGNPTLRLTLGKNIKNRYVFLYYLDEEIEMENK